MALDTTGFINALITKFGYKGEFETTAKYQQRLKDAAANQVFGGVGLDSLLAFKIEPEDGHLVATYNADKQLMDVTLPIYTEQVENDNPAIELKCTRSPATSYVATNSMGASVQVAQFTEENLRCNFRNIKHLIQKGEYTYDQVEFPIAAADAEREKASLAVLIIGKLSGKSDQGIDGLIIYQDRHQTPTVDLPYDVVRKNYCMRMDVQQVWVYDQDTGAVLWRKSASSK